VLRFHGRPECDYADLLADPGDACEVAERGLRALLGRGGWRAADLENLREDGILAAALDGLPHDLRRLVSVERQAPCPAVSAAVGGPGVFTALAGKDKLRQYHRKLGRLGPVTFEHLERRDAILEHLPRFFRQHQERSVLAGRDSQFLDHRPRRFYEELVRAMDPATELRFGVLRAGDRVAAYHFGFESNGRFLFYKPTFDVALWDYSPGQVLLRALFEYAEARALGVFDFTIGDEEYKHRFANEVVHTLRVTVARSAAGARASRLVRSARARLREVPAVRSLAATLRGRSSSPRSPGGAVFAFRAAPAGPAPGSPPAERGGLAELAGLSLEYPSAFPSAAIPDLRLRLKQDELWIARRDGRLFAAAWCGERDTPALWPGAARSRVLYDAWTAEERDQGWWTDCILAAAAAAREEELPLLAVSGDGGLLSEESARRGWPMIGQPAGVS
jgi:CelD/BcsL family acetyltransferase involved in cellulose biosynthesis